MLTIRADVKSYPIEKCVGWLWEKNIFLQTEAVSGLVMFECLYELLHISQLSQENGSKIDHTALYMESCRRYYKF